MRVPWADSVSRSSLACCLACVGVGKLRVMSAPQPRIDKDQAHRTVSNSVSKGQHNPVFLSAYAAVVKDGARITIHATIAEDDEGFA